MTPHRSAEAEAAMLAAFKAHVTRPYRDKLEAPPPYLTESRDISTLTTFAHPETQARWALWKSAWTASRLTLEAEVQTLRDALEPFAAHAERYEPDEGDDAYDAWGSSFTIGDLRKARAAWTKGKTS